MGELIGKIPCMTKPCNNCPFRKDCTPQWLGKDRMTSILEDDSFTCHKTTDCVHGRKQCAGYMLIKNGESAFERLAKILGEDLMLQGRELIFDAESDCINHHTVKK